MRSGGDQTLPIQPIIDLLVAVVVSAVPCFSLGWIDCIDGLVAIFEIIESVLVSIVVECLNI